MSSSSAQPMSGAAPSESLWPEAEMDATLLGTSTYAPPSSAAESPLAWAWSTVCQWLSFFRGLTLAAGSAMSGAVAAGGLAVLLFLAFTASLAPASDTFSRPLSLDFSQPDLLAQAVFLPDAQLNDGLPPVDAQRDARFLVPQQAVDVWAELEVPRGGGGGGQGLAQVVVQLTSLDGRVAAKTSRVVRLQSDPWSPRSLLLGPLRWLGLASDLQRVHVPLFHSYKEKRDVPFMAALVAIKTRNPACGAPEVMSATLKVRLRLGWVRRAIYWVRPGRLALPLVGAAAAAALLGGSAAAAVFLALLLFTGFGGSREAGGAADEVGSVAASEEAEVSSVSGVSEASSSLLRQLSEEEGEPPSPRQQLPAMPAPAAAAWGRRSMKAAGAGAAAERWRDVLVPGVEAPSSRSIASGSVERVAKAAAGPAQAGKGGGEYKPPKGAAAGRPADSAMGSEPGAGSGLLAGVLRRRAGTGAKPSSSL